MIKVKKQIQIGLLILLFVLIYHTTSLASTATVNTDTLKLRKEASTESTVLELLNQGQKLDVIEQSGDWVKVKVNGIIGFVHKDYIIIEEDTQATTNSNTQNEVAEPTTTTQNEVEQNTVNEIENTTTQQEIEVSMLGEQTLKQNADAYILPLINASKIANLAKDTKVTVVEELSTWLYVQTDEINAWVRKEYIQEKKSSNNAEETSSNNVTENKNNNENTNNNTNEIEETQITKKVMYINSPSVYVRKGPSTTYEAIDSLILNAQVNVIAESGDWYKVEVNGKTGYIAKRLLSANQTQTTSRGAEEREKEANVEMKEEPQTITQETSSKGEQIVAYAKQFLGCKYVYGGSGPSTFDCSGFTMYVYKQFGISLSHSARAQAKNGTYVAKEDLQPGDLVFFKDYETMDGIGHCGIYIGDGNFIHASSGTGYCVKISTLLSGSYLKRYDTARRLI